MAAAKDYRSKINEIGKDGDSGETFATTTKTGVILSILAGPNGRRRFLVIALLAVIFTLPSLWVGFSQDDIVFLTIFKGAPGLEDLEMHPLNTFSFSEGDLEKNRIRMELGILPWWTAEGWKVDLWRPLASLTHLADFKLFGNHAWPMHMHSILLYALLCVIAGVLYSRLIPYPWAAVLAAILFAIDGGHGVPAGWLSNRNAVLAALFGILTLLAHDRWRRSRNSSRMQSFFPHGILACLWLTLALFSSESAVGTGAYLFSYALFLDPLVLADDPLEKRWAARIKAIAALLPYLAVVIIWRAVYTGLGHGTHGSWLYTDPVADPHAFLMLGIQRFPVLLLGLFGMPDSFFWNALDPWGQYIYTAVALVILGFMACVVWPSCKRRPVMLFCVVGAILSTVPLCATIPQDRLLMFPSIGAMGLVALFLVQCTAGTGQSAPTSHVRRRAAKVLAIFLICAHVIVAPIHLLASSYGIKCMDRVFTTANSSVPVDEHGADTRFIVINTSLDLLGAFLPAYRSAYDMPVPKSWWWLSAGEGPVEVERIDERTLALRPEGGFLQLPWTGIFRRPSNPMSKGQIVHLSAMDVEVFKVDATGRPVEARFMFRLPLETLTFKWLTLSNGIYKPFRLPATGETVTVPGADSKDILRIGLGLMPRSPSQSGPKSS